MGHPLVFITEIAHHLVLVMVVKNSQLTRFINRWVIYILMFKYYETNLF